MSNEEALPSVQETSIKRLVVGPLNIRLHSSAVHRILKMIICAMDHEYEPYSKQRQGQAFSQQPLLLFEVSSFKREHSLHYITVALITQMVEVASIHASAASLF